MQKSKEYHANFNQKQKKKTFAKKTIWKYKKTRGGLENYKKIGPEKKSSTTNICDNIKI